MTSALPNLKYVGVLTWCSNGKWWFCWHRIESVTYSVVGYHGGKILRSAYLPIEKTPFIQEEKNKQNKTKNKKQKQKTVLMHKTFAATKKKKKKKKVGYIVL